MSETELVDMVNSEGVVTKRNVPRELAEKLNGEELHIQIIIAVIRNKSGEVLAHQRAAVKKREKNKVDHVCGAVSSGEKPLETVIREAQEEVGVTPKNLELIRQGINVYGYYCYLFSARSDDPPGDNLNPSEVAWARYMDLESIEATRISGELIYVDDFFEDLEAVINHVEFTK